MQLKEALSQLDPAIDEHWTSDGLPRMDAVAAITEDASVTRKMVTDADPELTRETAPEVEYVDDDEEEEGADGEEEEAVVEAEPEDQIPPSEPQTEEEIEDDIMDMPPQEIFGDADLTAIASRAIDRKIVEATRTAEAAAEELRQLYAKCELCKRATLRHEANSPAKVSPVQAYLRGQIKAREIRAKRAKTFIDAGTTAQDVAEQLRPGSRLDAAMSQRKPSRGSQRPATRPLAG